MLPAHHTEIWDHDLESGILACPRAIDSMVAVKTFLLPLIHLADLGIGITLSADKGEFCETFDQYDFKCDVVVWNEKHTTFSPPTPKFSRTICIRLSRTQQTVMTIFLVCLVAGSKWGENGSWMLVKPSVYWLSKRLKHLPQSLGYKWILNFLFVIYWMSEFFSNWNVTVYLRTIFFWHHLFLLNWWFSFLILYPTSSDYVSYLSDKNFVGNYLVWGTFSHMICLVYLGLVECEEEDRSLACFY